MAQAVKYKKPRKVNVVSFVLAGIGALLLYLGYQYIPNYMLEQEVYRVLEETSSHFSGKEAMYMKLPEQREGLRRKMHNNLRVIGVDDPDSESWIDVEGTEIRFGVIYSKWITWPFDVIAKQEKVYEVEHTIVVKVVRKD